MSQPKGNTYTFGFAAVICICCAFILANAATVLKPRQEANAHLDVAVNILACVGHDVPDLKGRKANEVFDLFDKEFNILLLDKNNKETDTSFMVSELSALGYDEAELKSENAGTLLTRFDSKKGILARKAGKSIDAYDPNYKVVYLHQKEGATDAYVIPIMGYGLWDIIKGYVALDTDLNTIKGITFYEHKETPGLGARVTEDWFKDNFKGKKVLDGSGNLVSVTIAKGKGSGDHQVDGISGATLTGKGVNQFLMADLARYEPYFQTVRSQ